MEFLLEVIFQVLAELLLQFVVQLLFVLGWQTLAAPFQRRPHPVFAIAGYALFGAVAGALTLWLFPARFIVSAVGRVAGLVLTPLLAGAAMMALAAWRAQHDTPLALRFFYGYLFALCLALVRFHFGR